MGGGGWGLHGAGQSVSVWTVDDGCEAVSLTPTPLSHPHIHHAAASSADTDEAKEVLLCACHNYSPFHSADGGSTTPCCTVLPCEVM